MAPPIGSTSVHDDLLQLNTIAGTGPFVCDTQEQAKRYVAHYHGDKEAAVRAVNRGENDPRACGVATAAFVRGPQMATARAENMAFEIIRILVLGIDSQDGFRPVQPAPYFTAFGVTEYHV